jgi:RNA polymerase sigma factor FliA
VVRADENNRPPEPQIDLIRNKTAKHPCRPRTGSVDTPVQSHDQPASQSPAVQSEDAERTLIRVVAWQVYARLPRYSGVELSDLLQAGYVGLLRAKKTYRTDKDVQFLVYARFRIRGEILDMLRRLDRAPRSLRRWQRDLDSGSFRLSAHLQRLPTEEEISESLGIELAVIRKNRQALWAASVENDVAYGHQDDCTPRAKEWASAADWPPDAIHERNESLRVLLDCVGSLPARSQKVILLYYRQNLTMKQIGALLSVNESRVSQIHKAALRAMSDGLHSAGITSPPSFQK